MTAVKESYNWAGTGPRGEARCGRSAWLPEELPAIVEDYYRKGWRSLAVARGGSVPPSPGTDLVAAIGPSPDTGHRVWWAEAPDPWKCPRCRCLFTRAGADHEPCRRTVTLAARAVQLDRMARPRVLAIVLERGGTWIMGGPGTWSKDELIAEILRAEFPEARAPQTEWKRCPACGYHAHIVTAIGICGVCDGE